MQQTEGYRNLKDRVNRVRLQGQGTRRTLQCREDEVCSLLKASNVSDASIEASLLKLSQLYDSIDTLISQGYPLKKYAFHPEVEDVAGSSRFCKYATGTSPLEFSVQYFALEDRLKEIKSKLKKKLSSRELNKFQCAREGDSVIAMDLTGSLVRGVLSACHQQMVTLVDIDTGEYRVANMDSVYNVDEDTASLHALYVKCALQGMPPDLTQYWNSDLGNYFRSALKHGDLLIEFSSEEYAEAGPSYKDDVTCLPPKYEVRLDVCVQGTSVLQVNEWICDLLLPKLKQELETCCDLHSVIRNLDVSLIMPYFHSPRLGESEETSLCSTHDHIVSSPEFSSQEDESSSSSSDESNINIHIDESCNTPNFMPPTSCSGGGVTKDIDVVFTNDNLAVSSENVIGGQQTRSKCDCGIDCTSITSACPPELLLANPKVPRITAVIPSLAELPSGAPFRYSAGKKHFGRITLLPTPPVCNGASNHSENDLKKSPDVFFENKPTRVLHDQKSDISLASNYMNQRRAQTRNVHSRLVPPPASPSLPATTAASSVPLYEDPYAASGDMVSCEENYIPVPSNSPNSRGEGVSLRDHYCVAESLFQVVPVKLSKPVLILEPGQTSRAMIAHIEGPNHFFVNIVDGSTALMDDLDEEMNEYYSGGENIVDLVSFDEARYHLGEFVACKWTQDGRWYRAQVLTWNEMDKKVAVMFVDHGNVDLVSFDNVQPLHPRFARLFMLAQQCHLANIAPINPKLGWSFEATKMFEKFCTEDSEHEVFTVTFQPANNGSSSSWSVLICNDKSECINDLLVSSGHASPVQNQNGHASNHCSAAEKGLRSIERIHELIKARLERSNRNCDTEQINQSDKVNRTTPFIVFTHPTSSEDFSEEDCSNRIEKQSKKFVMDETYVEKNLKLSGSSEIINEKIVDETSVEHCSVINLKRDEKSSNIIEKSCVIDETNVKYGATINFYDSFSDKSVSSENFIDESHLKDGLVTNLKLNDESTNIMEKDFAKDEINEKLGATININDISSDVFGEKIIQESHVNDESVTNLKLNDKSTNEVNTDFMISGINTRDITNITSYLMDCSKDKTTNVMEKNIVIVEAYAENNSKIKLKPNDRFDSKSSTIKNGNNQTNNVIPDSEFLKEAEKMKMFDENVRGRINRPFGKMDDVENIQLTCPSTNVNVSHTGKVDVNNTHANTENSELPVEKDNVEENGSAIYEEMVDNIGIICSESNEKVVNSKRKANANSIRSNSNCTTIGDDQFDNKTSNNIIMNTDEIEKYYEKICIENTNDNIFFLFKTERIPDKIEAYSNEKLVENTNETICTKETERLSNQMETHSDKELIENKNANICPEKPKKMANPTHTNSDQRLFESTNGNICTKKAENVSNSTESYSDQRFVGKTNKNYYIKKTKPVFPAQLSNEMNVQHQNYINVFMKDNKKDHKMEPFLKPRILNDQLLITSSNMDFNRQTFPRPIPPKPVRKINQASKKLDKCKNIEAKKAEKMREEKYLHNIDVLNAKTEMWIEITEKWLSQSAKFQPMERDRGQVQNELRSESDRQCDHVLREKMRNELYDGTHLEETQSLVGAYVNVHDVDGNTNVAINEKEQIAATLNNVLLNVGKPSSRVQVMHNNLTRDATSAEAAFVVNEKEAKRRARKRAERQSSIRGNNEKAGPGIRKLAQAKNIFEYFNHHSSNERPAVSSSTTSSAHETTTEQSEQESTCSGKPYPLPYKNFSRTVSTKIRNSLHQPPAASHSKSTNIVNQLKHQHQTVVSDHAPENVKENNLCRPSPTKSASGTCPLDTTSGPCPRTSRSGSVSSGGSSISNSKALLEKKWRWIDMNLAPLLTSKLAQKIKIRISRVSNVGKFYGQLENVFPDIEHAYKVLFREMNTPEVVNAFERLERVEIHKLVLAQEQKTRRWYRAIIQDYNEAEDRIKVFFVDSGTESYLPLQSLREMNLSFSAVPFQAVQCVLYNLLVTAKSQAVSYLRYGEYFKMWAKMIEVGREYEATIMTVAECQIAVNVEVNGFDLSELFAVTCCSPDIKLRSLETEWSNLV